MLINPSSINPIKQASSQSNSEVLAFDENSDNYAFVNSPKDVLHRIIGKIERGVTKHFYSHGTFNSVRLLMHVLKQTGRASVMMATYSISEKSIKTLKSQCEKGNINDIRFLVDNRVKSISPIPFNSLVGAFPNSVRTLNIHAKITLIWNNNWHISIVTSMNATDNNKIERGVISTNPEVFHFDYGVLISEFEKANK
jgi:hypothetical protein